MDAEYYLISMLCCARRAWGLFINVNILYPFTVAGSQFPVFFSANLCNPFCLPSVSSVPLCETIKSPGFKEAYFLGWNF